MHSMQFLTVCGALLCAVGYVTFPDCLEEAFRPMDDRGIRAAQSCLSPVTHLLARSVGCEPLPLPNPFITLSLSLPSSSFSPSLLLLSLPSLSLSLSSLSLSLSPGFFSPEFASFAPFLLFFFCHDQAAIFALSHALVLIFSTQLAKRFIFRFRPYMRDRAKMVSNIFLVVSSSASKCPSLLITSLQ